MNSDLVGLVRFSLIELEMMGRVECPIEQDIYLDDILRDVGSKNLDNGQKRELKRRIEKVIEYRKRIRNYLDVEPTQLYFKLFKVKPNGNITVSASSYHLIISSDEVEIGHGYFGPANNLVKIPKLRGLVEMKDKKGYVLDQVLADVLEGKVEDVARETDKHEQEHVRFHMVVRSELPIKPYDFETTKMHLLVLKENYKRFFNNSRQSELSAILVDGGSLIVPSTSTEKHRKEALEWINYHKRKTNDPSMLRILDELAKEYNDFFDRLLVTCTDIVNSSKDAIKLVPRKALAYILCNSELYSFNNNLPQIIDIYKQETK